MLLLAQEAFGWDKVLGPLAGACITGLFAIIVWWLNRKRPNKVLVQELEIDSLVRIAKTVRPRIVATLDGEAVAGLSQAEVSITNSGAETIKDIVLEFKFSPDTRVLECELSATDASKEIVAPNTLRISIPFLNSHRHHGDRLTAKIICDGDVDKYAVTGRGEGWSIDHKPVDAIIRFRFKVAFIAILIGYLVTLGYSRLMRINFGIYSDDISWWNLIANLPLLLALGAMTYAIGNWLRKATRLRRR